MNLFVTEKCTKKGPCNQGWAFRLFGFDMKILVWIFDFWIKDFIIQIQSNPIQIRWDWITFFKFNFRLDGSDILNF